MNDDNFIANPTKKTIDGNSSNSFRESKKKLNALYVKKVIDFLNEQNSQLQNNNDSKLLDSPEEEIKKMKIASQVLGIKYAALLKSLKPKTHDAYKENIKRQEKDNFALKKQKIKQITLAKLHQALKACTNNLRGNSQNYKIFLNKCNQFKQNNQTSKPIQSNSIIASPAIVKSFAKQVVASPGSISPRSTPAFSFQPHHELYATFGKPGDKDYYTKRKG